MLARRGAPGRARTCIPRRDLGYGQAGYQLPNRRMCRGAGFPFVSKRVAAADGSPLPLGSGACLMLFTLEFAPTP